jgi:SagB-type dehydrogenase family enzyme
MKKSSAEKIYDIMTFNKLGVATSCSSALRKYLAAGSFSEHDFLRVKNRCTAQSLLNVLQNRTSCRRFSPEMLTLSNLASILLCAYSLKNKQGSFTVPLAGGLAVMQISLLVRREDAWWVYTWNPISYKLQKIAKLKTQIRNLFFNKTTDISLASGIVIINAQLNILAKQYGARAYKFACIQAGHIAQNILLAAQECKVESLVLGALKENEISDALSLSTSRPLYAVVLGSFKKGKP